MNEPFAIPEAVEQKLAADPHRPSYHFLPPANWLNDPNGLIQWQGRYHLFYQYNPNGAFHGTIHWGHAVSDDLVHWQQLPVALTPTPGGPDAAGCWSGCAVDNNGTATIIYSGHIDDGAGQRQLPCLATSRADDLIEWDKYLGNPIIPAPPDGLDLVGFRDHSVWREGETWYQIIGAGIKDVGGTVLLYQSHDLIRWEYVNPILTGDLHQTEPLWTGTLWECPDLFTLADKHVLLISVHNDQTLYSVYFIGRYADGKFSPALLKKLDFGNNYFYAPQKLIDDAGRRLIWGWIQEGRSKQAQREAGWSGVMSLPRVLSIHPSGLLGVEPAPELQALRGQHEHLTDIEISANSAGLLRNVQGDCLEIIAHFELPDEDDAGAARAFGLKVRCSPDGQEETRLGYDRETRRLFIDRSRSSTDPAVERHGQGGQLDLAPGEGLSLHLYLDRSVIELFANGRSCLTNRIYPTRADSLGLELFAHEGRVRLNSLDIWKLL